MAYLKNQAKTYLITLFIIFPILIIYALLLYFKKIPSSIEQIEISSFIMGLLFFLILGFCSGIICKEKHLLKGFISALFLIIIFVLLKLISHYQLSLREIIKYLAYLVITGMGSLLSSKITYKPLNRGKHRKIKR